MTLPKFILGDNTDHPNAIYVIHTDFPRFIINLEDDYNYSSSLEQRKKLREYLRNE